MARNKGRSKMQDDEVIDQDEVIYEEEKGAKGAGASTAAPQSFVEKYRNLLLVGGVGILAIAGYFIYNYMQRDKVNEEAMAEMVMPVVYYERDSMSRAINGDGQSPTLVDIVENYGSTKAGNMARYYLGTAYLAINNLDDGIATLEEHKKGDNMISAAAYGALGYAYEQKGDFAAAAENYKLASSTPKENMYSTPFYLMHAARNYESANQKEEALQAYKDIKTKFPLSEEVRLGAVDRGIAKLSPEDFE